MEDTADIGGDAMMASGNPYAMAGGAALKVFSAAAKRRRAEAQAKADAENKRRSNLMSAMSQLGSGIGSTGMA